MSYLIKEDEEFLHVYAYLHDNSDEFSEWLYDNDDKFAYPKLIVDADGGALYEVRIDYRIRKSDGKVFLDGVST